MLKESGAEKRNICGYTIEIFECRGAGRTRHAQEGLLLLGGTKNFVTEASVFFTFFLLLS
jgi:hypothetical protein